MFTGYYVYRLLCLQVIMFSGFAYTLVRYKFGNSWERGRLVRILQNRRLACFEK